MLKILLIIAFIFPLTLATLIPVSPEEYPLVSYQNPNSVVLFYNSSSPVSNRFLAEFEKLAENIENLAFLTVDMTQKGEKPFEDLEVLPNVRVFLEDREAIEYLGVYSEPDLRVFIEGLLYRPQIIEISEGRCQEFDELKGENEVLVCYFGEAKEGEKVRIFREIAEKSKEHAFVLIHDRSLISKYSQRDTEVVIFRLCGSSDPEWQAVKFEGLFERKALESFIAEKAVTCLNRFTERIAQRLFGEDSAAFLILFLDEKRDSSELSVLKDFAKEHHEEMLMTFTPTTHGIGSRIARLVGVPRKSLPKAFILLQEFDDLVKYPLNSDLTFQSLELFLRRFREKRMMGYFRTGFSAINESLPVPLINAKDFNERVIFEEKHVIMIFEKPGCSVCKNVTELVARFLELPGKRDRVRGYRLDYLEDELWEMKVGSFPAVYFFRKADKMRPAFFMEEKSEEGLFEFFEENIGAGKSEKPSGKREEL